MAGSFQTLRHPSPSASDRTHQVFYRLRQGAAEQPRRAEAATELHSRAADIVTLRDRLRSFSQPQRSDAAGASYSRAA